MRASNIHKAMWAPVHFAARVNKAAVIRLTEMMFLRHINYPLINSWLVSTSSVASVYEDKLTLLITVLNLLADNDS